ncbi:hypothetical protein Mesau_03508 [Mesorhizobium australicum WSM2073]|uniref:Uncharacterized protein n=1 Tax=Mesorhizobium australicum (strain HAMBI 3006 / LMG 24608 / WSM2073) TaxID=754035 RepID=L0KL89_MESAW|nr:hypothetical protein Mesau_03508 [Mesorhizobium australicum WSM2073]
MTPRQDLVIHVMMYALIAYSIWVLAHGWVTMTVPALRGNEWVAYADNPTRFWDLIFFHAGSIVIFSWLLWALKYRRRN